MSDNTTATGASPDHALCGAAQGTKRAPSFARRNSRNVCSSGQSGFQGLEPYSFLIELSPRAPNFEKTPTVAIEEGETAEAAINSVRETIEA